MGTALDKELSPSARYIDKAERYLEEAKETVQGYEIEEARKHTLILASIASSLIALAKKQ